MACIATAFDPFWLTGVFAGADCPTVARRTSTRVLSLNGAGAEGGVAAAFRTVETVSEVKAEEVAARPATIASFVATARERFITCPSKKLHPDGPPGLANEERWILRGGMGPPVNRERATADRPWNDGA